jgi:hypothetical protein
MGLNNRNILSILFFCIFAFISFDAKAGCYATFIPSSNEITVKWDMSGCDHADDSDTELFEVCWSHGSLSTSANSCNINKKQLAHQTGSFSIPASPAITYDTKTSYYQWFTKKEFPGGLNKWNVLNKGSVTTPAEVVTTESATVSHCKADTVMSDGKITVNWDIQGCDDLKLSGRFAKLCWSHGYLDTYTMHCGLNHREFSDLIGTYDILTSPGKNYKVSFGHRNSFLDVLISDKNIMQASLTTPETSATNDIHDSGHGKIVTLGDSYASGDGFYRGDWGYAPDTADDKYHAFTYNKSRECWRATMNNELPGARLALENNMQSVVLACKGARVENVDVQYEYLKTKLPAEVNKKWAGSAFVIVAGGNDLHTQEFDNPDESWVQVISKCEGDGIDAAKHCNKEKYKFNNLPYVHDKLLAFYSKLAREASASKIRVMGYPQVMKPKNGRCKGARAISADEATFMDVEMGKVTDMVKGVVDEVKAKNPNVDIRFVVNNIDDGVCTQDDFHNANHVKDIHSVVWKRSWNASNDNGRKRNPAGAAANGSPLSTAGLIDMTAGIPLGAETNEAENKCAADAIAQMKACAVSGRGRLVRPGEGRGNGPINTTVKAGQGKDAEASINTTIKAGQGRDGDGAIECNFAVNTTGASGRAETINSNATANDMRGGPIDNTSSAGSGKGDPKDNVVVNDCDLIRSAISSNQVLSIEGNGGRSGATKVSDQNSNAKLNFPELNTDASFHPTRRGWNKFYENLKAGW